MIPLLLYAATDNGMIPFAVYTAAEALNGFQLARHSLSRRSKILDGYMAK